MVVPLSPGAPSWRENFPVSPEEGREETKASDTDHEPSIWAVFMSIPLSMSAGQDSLPAFHR